MSVHVSVCVCVPGPSRAAAIPAHARAPASLFLLSQLGNILQRHHKSNGKLCSYPPACLPTCGPFTKWHRKKLISKNYFKATLPYVFLVVFYYWPQYAVIVSIGTKGKRKNPTTVRKRWQQIEANFNGNLLNRKNSIQIIYNNNKNEQEKINKKNKRFFASSFTIKMKCFSLWNL